ncbi:MAG: polyprenyl synthetase family protein [Nitrososphaerota archaeon]|jgi:geranylgeranyl diphosphate synthase type I|nr:polyprenyl synthetase family protein [Nitrososphaerota archaeon]
MSLEAEMKRVASLVDGYIKESVKGYPAILYDASYHLLAAGGKRLRPFILLKFHSIYSADESAALPAAAAVELVHNFTLIHDDIMDNDELRRGVPTVHKRFGEAMAILAGDVLFAKAFRLISESQAFRGDPSKLGAAVSELAGSLVTVCEGQALDLNPPRLEDFTEKFYFDMIHRKTSALFEASAVLGCVAGGGGPDAVTKAREYADHLGAAFQLVDDLLGIAGDSSVTGKPVGGDIVQGKRTLPLLIALKLADRGWSETILATWGSRKASQETVDKIVKYIKEIGVEAQVRKLASEHLEQALRSLESFPKGAAVDSLFELANVLTLRRM